MISAFFNAVFYDPIYNLLVTLLAIVPSDDLGVAVIILTVLVRLILLPLSLSAAKTQRAMRALEPKLALIKEKHKDNREEQALKTLELYREEKVRPFASFLIVFIQIPVLLALFWVFHYEAFDVLNVERLYAFTPTPAAVQDAFLGLIPMSGKSILLALIAGATQFLQAYFALSRAPAPKGTGMQADFNRVMTLQMRYVFPILIVTIAYSTSAAVALYFVTTNLVGVLQELYVRKKFGVLPPAAPQVQSS